MLRFTLIFSLMVLLTGCATFFTPVQQAAAAATPAPLAIKKPRHQKPRWHHFAPAESRQDNVPVVNLMADGEGAHA
jgi:hypothetical protein